MFFSSATWYSMGRVRDQNAGIYFNSFVWSDNLVFGVWIICHDHIFVELLLLFEDFTAVWLSECVLDKFRFHAECLLLRVCFPFDWKGWWMVTENDRLKPTLLSSFYAQFFVELKILISGSQCMNSLLSFKNHPFRSHEIFNKFKYIVRLWLNHITYSHYSYNRFFMHEILSAKFSFPCHSKALTQNE